MRRTLLIAAAVVVILLAGMGIYLAFFNHGAKLTATNGGSLPSSGNAPVVGPDAPSTQTLGVPTAGAGTDVAPRLVRVSDRPVALGAVAVYVPPSKQVATSTNASTTAAINNDPDVLVEYVERESGNIYGFMAHARTLTRYSNKTLPGVQEASWLSDGSLAFLRFLDDTGADEHISTYALPKGGDGGFFLEQDLAQVVTRGTSTLMTLLATTDGSSASVSSPTGSNLHTLFASPITSLRLAYFGKDFFATTKPSAKSDGYAFIVSASTGAFTRVLGPLQSLSTLPSPSGRYVLYSYLDRGKIALAVLDLDQLTSTRLPLSTLPDKCVWASDNSSIYCGVPTSMSGTEPDDWYQGAASFTDRLWRIDMAGRVATMLIDPSQAASIDMDMVGLTVDPTTDVLVFTNKKDGTLYAYDL